jgi:hypothetical protein
MSKIVRNNFSDKPGAFVDPKTCAIAELEKMIRQHPELYDKCLETIGFAYGFSQIANRAVHFDYLFSKGLIPIAYLDNTKKVGTTICSHGVPTDMTCVWCREAGIS